MDKRKKLIKLQKQARKKLIRKANKQAETLLKILQRYEADIVSHIAKQPKGSFEGFRLQKILENIKQRTKKLKEEILLSLNENSKQTFQISVEEARKLLKESFELNLKEEKTLLNVFNQIPEKALLFLQEYNLELSGDLTKDIYKRIKQKLQMGLLEGKSIPQMARDISLENIPAIPPFKNPYDRAKTIARTETARAYHNGQILIYKEFEIEEIIVICGKTPCPICQSHCDTIHPIKYADEVLKHPNCTCTFAPIKRKGKKLNTGNYYDEKKSLTEKKQWALNTAKNFYEKVEKKFQTIKTKEEAVEVFKSMFESEREFYKHLNRHILDEVYKSKKRNWKQAKEEDLNSNLKYSIEYLSLFLKTITKPSVILYQLPIGKQSLPRIVVYSKVNTFAIILQEDKIISVNENDFDTLEEWMNSRLENSKDEEILEVGLNEDIRRLYKTLQRKLRRFIL